MSSQREHFEEIRDELDHTIHSHPGWKIGGIVTRADSITEFVLTNNGRYDAIFGQWVFKATSGPRESSSWNIVPCPGDIYKPLSQGGDLKMIERNWIVVSSANYWTQTRTILTFMLIMPLWIL